MLRGDGTVAFLVLVLQRALREAARRRARGGSDRREARARRPDPRQDGQSRRSVQSVRCTQQIDPGLHDC